MLISNAYASAAQAAPGGSLLEAWLPLILVIAVFYFLILRPQNKRAQEHAKLVSGLTKGDYVLTSSGFYGKLTDVEDDDILMLEMSNGVIVPLHRHSVMDVVENPFDKKGKKSDKSDKSSKSDKKKAS